MSEHECERCGQSFFVPLDYEPTQWCNLCAQEIAADVGPDAAETVARLTEERDAYRYLAVSYARALRVSSRNVDDIVRARLAQRKQRRTGR